jgi:hypothetical protein
MCFGRVGFGFHDGYEIHDRSIGPILVERQPEKGRNSPSDSLPPWQLDREGTEGQSVAKSHHGDENFSQRIAGEGSAIWRDRLRSSSGPTLLNGRKGVGAGSHFFDSTMTLSPKRIFPGG